MAPPAAIDLNADLGEHDHPDAAADDPLLALISSANVACGFHAGGPATIRATVARAAARKVAIGAHPSYPDRAGFGRRSLDATPDEVYDDVLYQIGALAAFCRAAGVALAHVKPHGALYNHAALDAPTAEAIVAAVRACDPALAVFAPPGSALLRAAQDAGLPALAEAFADRAYDQDGTLRSRRLPGALLDDPEDAARQALDIARDGRVRAHDGTWLPLSAATICLHGDAPGALERARAVRQALQQAGIAIMATPPMPR